MAARRPPIAPLLLLAAALGGAWAFSAPFRAYADLKTAAREGRRDELQALVDFPAFRESVKEEVRHSVERGIAGDGAGNLASRIGGLLAGAVAAPVVDQVVSPDGIAALTEGARPGEQAGAKEAANGGEERWDVRRGYEDLSTFAVRFHDPETGRERVALLLHREGLSWRLRELRLPPPQQGEDEQ